MLPNVDLPSYLLIYIHGSSIGYYNDHRHSLLIPNLTANNAYS